MRQVVALTLAVLFVLIVVYLRTGGTTRNSQTEAVLEDPWSKDEASDLVALIELSELAVVGVKGRTFGSDRACLRREPTVRRRSLRPWRPDELDRRLRERLDALGPAPRAELLHVLMLPTSSEPTASGEFWGNPGIRVERGEAQCLRLPRRFF
jgi:hypothetical protein